MKIWEEQNILLGPAEFLWKLTSKWSLLFFWSVFDYQCSNRQYQTKLSVAYIRARKTSAPFWNWYHTFSVAISSHPWSFLWSSSLRTMATWSCVMFLLCFSLVASEKRGITAWVDRRQAVAFVLACICINSVIGRIRLKRRAASSKTSTLNFLH
jgi:hypothetical protein